MTAYSLPYVPRHADAADPTDGDATEASEATDAADAAEATEATEATDARTGDGVAAREHALALLAASPVYARVARLLGLDGPGAAGVRTEIGARLAQLPAGWHVLPAAAADHLVIGPAGVFAVVVRHHPARAVSVDGDTFRVDGRRERCLGEVRREASRLAKVLVASGGAAPVHAVLAVSGAQLGFAVKRQPRGVTVVNRRTITAYLHAQPPVLDAAGVERLVAVASSAA